MNENSELLPVPNAYDYVNKRKGLSRKERRRLAKELGVEFKPRYNGNGPVDLTATIVADFPDYSGGAK